MAASSITCPICDRENARDARRCRSCGADFEDVDLAAQLGRPLGGAGGGGDDEDINLLGDRFLGVRWLGLEVGGDLRTLALIGGLCFAVAAILPVNLDFEGVKAMWSVVGKGPTFALLLPVVCAALGIALATPLGRLLPAPAIAGALVAGGAAVLLFGVTPLGSSCALPERTPWLLWLGFPLAAAGVVVRAMRPRDSYVRWVVVGGAVLVLVGMALPHTDARPSLPGEYMLYMHDANLLDKSLAGASLDGFEHDVMVRFLSMWHLLGVALIVTAAALTIPTPTGPWDRFGLVLRPIGFVLVFYIPLTFAFYTVNIMGWRGADYVVWQDHYRDWDKFTNALFAGRARTLAVALPAAVWMAAGLAGLWASAVVPRLPTPPRAAPPPPPR